MQVKKILTSLTLILTIFAWMFSSAPIVHGQDEPPATNEPAQDVETETETATASATSTETATSTAIPSLTPTEFIAKKNQPVFISDEYVNDEVLIRFHSTRAKESLNADMKLLGGEIIDEIEELDVIRLKIPYGTVEAFIAEMRNKSGVVYVEPNYYLQALDTLPNDTSYPSQYGLANIRAPQGWDISTGSNSVIIAIIDSGVDINHPDLAGKIVGGVLGKGKDFVNNDDNAQDDFGHGTHVAGIAAASSNNGFGVSGVSWGAKIMPVKVLNSGGGGTFANAANGIIWAADSGAQIINLSLGSTSPSITLQNAINYAYGQGVTIVAAAGNDNGAVRYPAAYSNVIAVGATDSANARYGSSNYGTELDVVAPGVNIYSTRLGGTYGNNTGTSMSAAYVAGAAAILRNYISSPSAIQTRLESTALDLGAAGYDTSTGFGLIQLDAALLNIPSPPPNPAPNSASGWSPFNQPFPTLTFSPTSSNITITQASTLTSAATQTPTHASIDTPTSTITPTNIPFIKEQSAANYWLPCLGILCLLAGLLILFLVRNSRARSRLL